MSQDQGAQGHLYVANEPTVEELMADPIMSQILKSDRIRADEMWAMIVAARRRMAVQRWRSAPFRGMRRTA